AHFERLKKGTWSDRPEAKNAKGPGLCEICNQCAFFRPATADSVLGPSKGFDLPREIPSGTAEQRNGSESKPRAARKATLQNEASAQEPTVSLLFSGGVFRGVYQIGVANALQLMNLR